MRDLLKCIIWDLDGTLWDGALRSGAGREISGKNDLWADAGRFLRIRPAVCRVLEAADARGVIQSAASRNDPDAALAALGEQNLARFFIYPQIDVYAPKTAGIRKIMERFNISPSGVSFVDDDEFERYQARRYFPEMAVHAPDENGLDALAARIAAVPENFTRERPELMRARERRLEAEAAFSGSREEFLAECGMRLEVRKALPGDIPRVEELALRTNRLNNTRERPGAAELAGYLAAPGRWAYVCSLTDIFGRHGVVGAALLRAGDEEGVFHLDLFCVSCRVEGRGIGAAFLSAVLGENGVMRGRKPGNAPPRALCEYIVNRKDLSAYMLLKSLGFYRTGGTSGAVEMALDLPAKGAGPGWVEVINGMG
ncbi:MAG: HAD-IIIC family phosphatase [Firmicutes bacterium]|nr:HAD-IIIC family phosphatase [Bacillota bacterium]